MNNKPRERVLVTSLTVSRNHQSGVLSACLNTALTSHFDTDIQLFSTPHHVLCSVGINKVIPRLRVWPVENQSSVTTRGKSFLRTAVLKTGS